MAGLVHERRHRPRGNHPDLSQIHQQPTLYRKAQCRGASIHACKRDSSKTRLIDGSDERE
jgi:hypothetical protein